MLSEEKIISALAERTVELRHVKLYATTDSTNLRAKEYAHAHPDSSDGVLFIAEHQTSGRGRLGKSFYSAGGAGIYMSLIIKPADAGALVTRLTALSAVAVAEAIERASGLTTGIKWVNDVYVGKRKVCGILAEGVMTQDGQMPYLVLGIGINVYKTAYPEDISSIATSIEDESGRRIPREELIADIIASLLEEIAYTDSEEIYERYLQRDIVTGKDITVIRGTESYAARVIRITEDFSLEVEREGGERELLFSGEISTRL